MSAFSGVMKFIMIIFVIILTIFIIAFALMFFIPGFRLFGFHYITCNNSYYSELVRGTGTEHSDMWNDADVVRIETGGYDINVCYVDKGIDAGEVKVTMNGSYRGFVSGKVDMPTYDSTEISGKYYEDNSRSEKIYYIKIDEPTGGFLLRTDNVLNVYMVNNELVNKSVEIVTRSGAVTFADNTKVMDVKNLKIVSNSGSVVLNQMSLAPNGKLEIEKSKSGTITSNADLYGDIKINVLGGGDRISLKDIGYPANPNSKLYIKSRDSKVTLGNVYGDFECACHGASLTAGTITGSAKVNVTETACKFYEVGSIEGVDTLWVESNGSASVYCEYVLANAILKMGKSSVTLDNTYGKVDFESSKGNLTIKNAMKDVLIGKTSGQVSVDFNEYCVSNLTSTATAGTIKFNNMQGEVKINELNEQSSCKIIGTFLALNGKNIIQTTSGNIELTCPLNTDWSLFWQAKNVSLDIFGTAKTTIKSSEQYIKSNYPDDNTVWTTAYGKPTSEMANSLKLLSSSGKIVVKAQS
ncbi:MAG: hypothetical protein IJ837_01590 [Clostridia bacterium]|nr:hypothetical protein [Clostridia bacterium]